MFRVCENVRKAVNAKFYSGHCHISKHRHLVSGRAVWFRDRQANIQVAEVEAIL
jgi:hypothetical protein